MPSPEQIRAFVMAAHGDLAQVQRMLEAEPALLNLPHAWRPDDLETAIQAAAHTGQQAIALYLLERGAPLEIPTAAMLGDVARARTMLDQDPSLAKSKGAHGIPLLPHAALSGDPAMLELVFSRGAREGVEQALHLAILQGQAAAVAWLLENARPNLAQKGLRGKTALELAQALGHKEIEALLRSHEGG
ncbi:ankyrin repeat domain-containing protein [Meiothermus sp. QL-1]|uniref:ankyrin repeat domain-containing protein n=1 Tax=Meiothermus sp. QL-1 TaxID=2058095 RepID=UPI000E0BBA44|nr:ankyrin repeat domain-containing protein [Meiothermus sp. QL-1]RDI95186.1 ankyrin repeat domain-containing protein [Meiothermus sp. QL-1]